MKEIIDMVAILIEKNDGWSTTRQRRDDMHFEAASIFEG